MMSPPLRRLYETHAAFKLEKQLCFSAFLKGSANWKFSKESGLLSFGGANFFPTQVLGTESEASHTWLWSWANEANPLPPRLVKNVQALRQFGERQKIDELTRPQLGLEVVGGTELAFAACGICKADAFYRGPYKGGAMFLLVDAPAVRPLWNSSPQRIVSIFTQLISTAQLDHRTALTGYLQLKGYKMALADQTIEATSPSGERLSAAFDAQGRLAKLQALVEPPKQ